MLVLLVLLYKHFFFSYEQHSNNTITPTIITTDAFITLQEFWDNLFKSVLLLNTSDL